MADRCIYCECDVDDETLVPDVGDDEAWDTLAAEHAEGCEWIATRAHRREAHPAGCSCGSPDCPEWQATQATV